LDARKATFLVMQLEMLKLDAVVPELKDPRMQRYFEITASGEVMTDEYLARLHMHASVRPFVSTAAWAAYSVYSNIVSAAIGKMKMLKIGQDPRRFFTEVHWAAILPGVLPADESRLVGTDSEHGLQWVLARLEERLASELQRSLGEGAAGLDSITDAKRILEATDKIETSRIEEQLRRDAPPGALKS